MPLKIPKKKLMKQQRKLQTMLKKQQKMLLKKLLMKQKKALKTQHKNLKNINKNGLINKPFFIYLANLFSLKFIFTPILPVKHPNGVCFLVPNKNYYSLKMQVLLYRVQYVQRFFQRILLSQNRQLKQIISHRWF